MAQREPEVIVISERDLESGPDPDRETIVITHEEVAQDEVRRLFEPPLLRCFVGFVSAGLPDAYLREHPELSEAPAQREIRGALERVPDAALRDHLLARLGAIVAER